ncbi:hypothetical protein EMCRGX_G028349 [Ephydatia muelleri]
MTRKCSWHWNAQDSCSRLPSSLFNWRPLRVSKVTNTQRFPQPHFKLTLSLSDCRHIYSVFQHQIPRYIWALALLKLNIVNRTYAYTSTCAYAYTSTCAYTSTSTCAYTYTSTCAYTYTSTCAYTYTSTCAYAYTSTCAQQWF